MSNIFEKASEVLFGKKEYGPDIPKAQKPAVPAPSRRTDTGAKVAIGADASKNQRVSGRRSGSTTGTGTTGGDVLGNLGKGGLSV